jgi:uncharacterized protein with FMN-binding domain
MGEEITACLILLLAIANAKTLGFVGIIAIFGSDQASVRGNSKLTPLSPSRTVHTSKSRSLVPVDDGVMSGSPDCNNIEVSILVEIADR